VLLLQFKYTFFKDSGQTEEKIGSGATLPNTMRLLSEA